MRDRQVEPHVGPARLGITQLAAGDQSLVVVALGLGDLPGVGGHVAELVPRLRQVLAVPGLGGLLAAQLLLNRAGRVEQGQGLGRVAEVAGDGPEPPEGPAALGPDRRVVALLADQLLLEVHGGLEQVAAESFEPAGLQLRALGHPVQVLVDGPAGEREVGRRPVALGAGLRGVPVGVVPGRSLPLIRCSSTARWRRSG